MSNRNSAFPYFFLVLIFVHSSASFARDREVSASGSCTHIVTPDRGQIIITAEAQDKDLKNAARNAAEIYERVSQAVKKLELESLELRTVEYGLSEVREWQKDKLVSKGFKARMGLRVSTASIQKLGDVIAVAAREEVRDVGSLTTYLSPEKLKKEEFACLQEASEDAHAKARKLAEATHVQLGEVITISENHSNPPGARPMMGSDETPRMAMMKSAAMPAPTIEAGQQEISVTVQAVFGLK